MSEQKLKRTAENSCKSIRKWLIERKFQEPLASSRLCRLGLDSNKLKAIYTFPFRLTKDTKLCMLHYKIIHNILPYGSKLYKMKISNSTLCVHCNSLETLPHMLVNCTEINSFWAKIISWWNHQSGDCYLVDELSILYGYYPEDKRTLIFNYFILLGKRHIFAQRFEQKTPNIDLFFDFVKGKLIVHKCIFQSKGLINKFHSLWKPLLCLL